ncbi:MAG: putative N-acetylmannosamine-6-phosphate 2-epimerase [Solobacterium sp.]|nr:putative N-acetylmannosamine-6-phosphate 2-epimerase [Solobacterium sp.]
MKTTDLRKRKILESLKGGLIVSCQVFPGEPFYTEDMSLHMAKAAEWAGAVAITTNSPEDVIKIKREVNLPVIGMNKEWSEDSEVFITPTLERARAIYEAGAEIIALDCTERLTHQKTIAWDLIPVIRREIPDAILFANVSNYDEGRIAIDNGVDIVAPTLYGYTRSTSNMNIDGPDFREFARMCRDFKDDAYVIMEGHIYSPEDAMKCIYFGAHAVVVGEAITRPHLTAKRYVELLNRYR